MSEGRRGRRVVAGALRKRGAPVARLLAVLGVAAFVAGGVVSAGALSQARAADFGPPQVAPEVPVTAMHQNVGPANNSPKLVADPTEPRFVVIANRLDAPDFSCALQVSGDGGRNWLPANPVPELPEGAEKCYAPEVAFDRDGTLYYLFVGLAGGGNEPMGVFLTSSGDRGRTFSPPHQILGPLNFAVRMVIDPAVGSKGRMHLVWIQATSDPPLGAFGPPPNPIMAAYSDDGGQTFSEPVQVSDPHRKFVVAPALALGPDHTVHVAYYDLEDDAVDYHGLEGPTWPDTWSIVANSSFDGGRSFGQGIVVDDAVKPHERVMLIFTMPPPSLVADGEGRVCAAWTDARFGDADALLRCSTDEGNNWSDVRRMNDDPQANGASQYMPGLSVPPDGARLDAIFYDRRDDPDNIRTHVYYTYSNDFAEGFARNLRLTSDFSNPEIGQRYVNPSAEGMVEFGSRIGLLARRSSAVAAWTDTRNSRPGTGQDVFATIVDFPASEARGGAPLWGIVLLTAGLILVVSAAVVSRHWLRRPSAAEGEAA